MLILIGLLAIVGILVVYTVLTYNRLIDLKMLTENSWAQIEVQLKRRFDLIPNLVETVKGYARHERKVFEEVSKLRTRFLNSKTVNERVRLNERLSDVLKTIFAVAERYPRLRANENFKELQKELTRTEDKIAYMRQFYNDTVYRYNTAIKQFPNNLIAKIFGFEPKLMFEAIAEEKKPIKIKF